MITNAPPLSSRARSVIDAFAGQDGVSADQGGCLRAVIYSSPSLARMG